jgi:hypothetical protein
LILEGQVKEEEGKYQAQIEGVHAFRGREPRVRQGDNRSLTGWALPAGSHLFREGNLAIE